ncbi:MAG: biotin--[acetyl-CoA-carboxylase] ligase [Candidatus Symbiothrix sp.]|jgi:BirA family biotin operon repressor/biotin-[acetyl-CoA-carboxylase] ligase|nr:biotin--[acetyl-CoA-carboxylase] ligase [Candidatus Symbiothrix sp.]
MNIIRLKTIDSTNRYLNDWAAGQDLEEYITIVAEQQIAGRGQHGNRWDTEAGKNLTFSLLLYPDFLPLSQQFLLSEAIALAVYDALNSLIANALLPHSFQIKWPNDIYFENRKIAGILIENELIGTKIERSIVGIGLNINQEQFSDELPNPVSLKHITGETTDLDYLLELIIKHITKRYEQLKSGETDLICSDYHAALYRKANFHPYEDKDGVFSACIRSVADNGVLRLLTASGEERLYSFKEIKYK